MITQIHQRNVYSHMKRYIRYTFAWPIRASISRTSSHFILLHVYTDRKNNNINLKATLEKKKKAQIVEISKV
jgi:hypothetical protein